MHSMVTSDGVGPNHFRGREHRLPVAGTRSLRAAQNCLAAIKMRSLSSPSTVLLSRIAALDVIKRPFGI
jgi:hypothetical protein